MLRIDHRLGNSFFSFQILIIKKHFILLYSNDVISNDM